MDYERQRAFTLVELLITLAIAALVIGLAAPPLAEFYRKQQLEGYEGELMRLIVHSRHHALAHVSRVTACATDMQGRCVSLKSGTLTSFVDNNNNRILEDGETVLYSLPIPGHLRVNWNRSTPYLHFNGRGVNGFNTGTFTLCHRAELGYYGEVVINLQGRPRKERHRRSCPLG